MSRHCPHFGSTFADDSRLAEWVELPKDSQRNVTERATDQCQARGLLRGAI
jgi:hypothetical protein